MDTHAWEQLRALRPARMPKLRVSMLDWQAPPEVTVDHVAGDVRVLQGFTSRHLEHARDIIRGQQIVDLCRALRQCRQQQGAVGDTLGAR